MDHDLRTCSRCGTAAGDFHFCPSCLAPVDSLSGISTGEILRSESTLVATADGSEDRIAGHDTTAVAQADPAEAAASELGEVTAQSSDLQIRLGDAPPTSRDVARLEDVLTIAPKGLGDPLELSPRREPHVSVPPPAPREVARLEDVLSVAPPEIAPKTAAASEAATVPKAPAGKVEPWPAAKSQPAERSYVPAYALRAAFWFEQASAFESSSEDEEADELPPAAAAPVESVPPPVTAPQAVPEPAPPARPQASHSWVFALSLLGLVALAAILLGRCPSRCADRKR